MVDYSNLVLYYVYIRNVNLVIKQIRVATCSTLDLVTHHLQKWYCIFGSVSLVLFLCFCFFVYELIVTQNSLLHRTHCYTELILLIHFLRNMTLIIDI